MSRARELVDKCAGEVAALCENTGTKLAALDQDHDVSSLGIALAIANAAVNKLENKLRSTPEGRALLESIDRQVLEKVKASRPGRKLDS